MRRRISAVIQGATEIKTCNWDRKRTLKPRTAQFLLQGFVVLPVSGNVLHGCGVGLEGLVAVIGNLVCHLLLATSQESHIVAGFHELSS